MSRLGTGAALLAVRLDFLKKLIHRDAICKSSVIRQRFHELVVFILAHQAAAQVLFNHAGIKLLILDGVVEKAHAPGNSPTLPCVSMPSLGAVFLIFAKIPGVIDDELQMATRFTGPRSRLPCPTRLTHRR